jgi:hypothetical protein
MTKKTPISWYAQAKESTDAEIQRILNLYEQKDAADPMRKDLAKAIQTRLADLKKNPFEPDNQDDEKATGENSPTEQPEETSPAEEQPGENPPEQENSPSTETEPPGVESAEEFENDEQEQPNPPAPPEKKHAPDKKVDAKASNKDTGAPIPTEEDVKKEKDPLKLQAMMATCRDEVRRLEDSRRTRATYQENLKLQKQIWIVQRVHNMANNKIHDLKAYKKAIEKDKAAKVSGLNQKRAKFVQLIRRGISITNAVADSNLELEKKEDLLVVLDLPTIEECVKHRADFRETWIRWAKKYLGTDL